MNFRKYKARLAITEQTKFDAYRVRYNSYLAAGHIEPNPTHLFKDKYDDLPNSHTIVIYNDDKPVASVRTCLLANGTGLTSPALDVFPDEVKRLLSADLDSPFAGRGIELTRLVRSPESESNQTLVLLLYRMARYIAICDHTQVILACVRHNHVPFYQRLGLRCASPLKTYPGLLCKMQLMQTDMASYDKICAALPLLDPLAGNTHNLEGFFLGEPVILNLTGPSVTDLRSVYEGV